MDKQELKEQWQLLNRLIGYADIVEHNIIYAGAKQFTVQINHDIRDAKILAKDWQKQL